MDIEELGGRILRARLSVDHSLDLELTVRKPEHLAR